MALRLAPVAVAALALLGLLAPGSSSAADCPGGAPACAYVASAQIGQQSGGVLRFPQAVAVAPDGTTYVGDQGSHVVQVFDATGAFVRQIGTSGSRPGELSAVGALALAGDGSLLVADGANRIDRFGVDGSLLNSWGRSGSAVGEFRFGGGHANDAGAGGGLAASGDVVYVADTGNDRLQRFTTDGGHGAEIVPSGQLRNPKGVAVRGTRLFVADDQNHRVVVMDTGGHTLTTIGSGNGTKPGQLNFPYGVALDPAGRVFVADNLNQRVLRFSSGPVYPYKGRWGSYGTGAGQLAYPRGIATDAQGLVYVTNTGNDRIDVFDKGGALVRSFGASGRASGQFNTPSGVAADAAGIRAVTDAVNGRVQFFGADGTFLSSWGSPAPGPTILRKPVAVAFDPAGNAYVLDQRRAAVIVFDRATGLPVRTYGGPGSGPGALTDPSAIAVGPDGTIYVADTGNRRVVRYAADGTPLEPFADIGGVRGVAVSPDGGRLYTTDSANRISVYAPSGERLSEFGGTGSKLGKLNAPAGIAVDAAGGVWVADRGNNRVQHFGPDGERLETLGERGTGAGQFIHPTAVSVDCSGTLTVTDTGNNRVQQFTLAAPPAVGCAGLGPLGTPAPPQLPTLPAPDGPQVTLRALRSAGVVGSRSLPLRAGCDTTCALDLEIELTPRAKPAKGKKRVTIVLEATGQVAAGETALLRPALTARQARSLTRALRGRRGLQADVRLTATASVGAPTTVVQRLKVTA